MILQLLNTETLYEQLGTPPFSPWVEHPYKEGVFMRKSGDQNNQEPTIQIRPYASPKNVHPDWSDADRAKIEKLNVHMQALQDLAAGRDPIEVALSMPEVNQSLRAGTLPLERMARLWDVLNQQAVNKQERDEKVRNIGEVGKPNPENLIGKVADPEWIAKAENRTNRMQQAFAAQPVAQAIIDYHVQNSGLPADKVEAAIGRLSDQQQRVATMPEHVGVVQAPGGAGKSLGAGNWVANNSLNGSPTSNYLYTSATHNAVNVQKRVLGGVRPLLSADDQQRLNAQEMFDEEGNVVKPAFNVRTIWSAAGRDLVRPLKYENKRPVNALAMLGMSHYGFLGFAGKADTSNLPYEQLGENDIAQGQTAFVEAMYKHFGLNNGIVSQRDALNYINRVKQQRATNPTLYNNAMEQGKNLWFDGQRNHKDAILYAYEQGKEQQVVRRDVQGGTKKVSLSTSDKKNVVNEIFNQLLPKGSDTKEINPDKAWRYIEAQQNQHIQTRNAYTQMIDRGKRAWNAKDPNNLEGIFYAFARQTGQKQDLTDAQKQEAINSVFSQMKPGRITPAQALSYIEEKQLTHNRNMGAYDEKLAAGQKAWDRGKRTDPNAILYAYHEANYGSRIQLPGVKTQNAQTEKIGAFNFTVPGYSSQPLLDPEDTVHLAANAATELRDERGMQYLEPYEGVWGEEFQNFGESHINYIKARTTKDSRILFTGDMSQQTVKVEGRDTPKIIQEQFENGHHYGGGVAFHNFTGNYRQGPGSSSFMAALGADLALANVPSKSPSSVSMNEFEGFPDIRYGRTYKEAYQPRIAEWFQDQGLTMAQVKENVRNGAHPLTGAIAPGQAPFISPMPEQGDRVVEQITNYMHQELGPELGRQAMEGLISRDHPTPENEHMMRVLTTPQTLGFTFGVPNKNPSIGPTVDVTQVGAWDQAGYLEQLQTMAGRASGRQTLIGTSVRSGRTPHNLTPQPHEYNGETILYPHGMLPFISRMVNYAVINEGVRPDQVNPEWQEFLHTPYVTPENEGEGLLNIPEGMQRLIEAYKKITGSSGTGNLDDPAFVNLLQFMQQAEQHGYIQPSAAGTSYMMDGESVKDDLNVKEDPNGNQAIEGYSIGTLSRGTVANRRGADVDAEQMRMGFAYIREMIEGGPASVAGYGREELPDAFEVLGDQFARVGAGFSEKKIAAKYKDQAKDIVKKRDELVTAQNQQIKEIKEEPLNAFAAQAGPMENMQFVNGKLQIKVIDQGDGKVKRSQTEEELNTPTRPQSEDDAKDMMRTTLGKWPVHEISAGRDLFEEQFTNPQFIMDAHEEAQKLGIASPFANVALEKHPSAIYKLIEMETTNQDKVWDKQVEEARKNNETIPAMDPKWREDQRNQLDQRLRKSYEGKGGSVRAMQKLLNLAVEQRGIAKSIYKLLDDKAQNQELNSEERENLERFGNKQRREAFDMVRGMLANPKHVAQFPSAVRAFLRNPKAGGWKEDNQARGKIWWSAAKSIASNPTPDQLDRYVDIMQRLADPEIYQKEYDQLAYENPEDSGLMQMQQDLKVAQKVSEDENMRKLFAKASVEVPRAMPLEATHEINQEGDLDRTPIRFTEDMYKALEKEDPKAAAALRAAFGGVPKGKGFTVNSYRKGIDTNVLTPSVAAQKGNPLDSGYTYGEGRYQPSAVEWQKYFQSYQNTGNAEKNIPGGGASDPANPGNRVELAILQKRLKEEADRLDQSKEIAAQRHKIGMIHMQRQDMIQSQQRNRSLHGLFRFIGRNAQKAQTNPAQAEQLRRTRINMNAGQIISDARQSRAQAMNKAMQKRMREDLIPLEERQNLVQPAIDQKRAMADQIEQWRAHMNNPETAQRYGHTAYHIMNATIGGRRGDSKEDQNKEKQFFSNIQNAFAPNMRTLGSLGNVMEVMERATQHLQATGTLKRRHIIDVLSALGHRPEDDLFQGLRRLEKKGNFRGDEDTISLKQMLDLIDNPQERENAMSGYTHQPFTPGAEVIFQGEARNKHTQGGLTDGMRGTIHAMPILEGWQLDDIKAAKAKGENVDYTKYLESNPKALDPTYALRLFSTPRGLGSMQSLGIGTQEESDQANANFRNDARVQKLYKRPTAVPTGLAYLFKAENGQQFPVRPEQLRLANNGSVENNMFSPLPSSAVLPTDEQMAPYADPIFPGDRIRYPNGGERQVYYGIPEAEELLDKNHFRSDADEYRSRLFTHSNRLLSVMGQTAPGANSAKHAPEGTWTENGFLPKDASLWGDEAALQRYDQTGVTRQIMRSIYNFGNDTRRILSGKKREVSPLNALFWGNHRDTEPRKWMYGESRTTPEFRSHILNNIQAMAQLRPPKVAPPLEEQLSLRQSPLAGGRDEANRVRSQMKAMRNQMVAERIRRSQEQRHAQQVVATPRPPRSQSPSSSGQTQQGEAAAAAGPPPLLLPQEAASLAELHRSRDKFPPLSPDSINSPRRKPSLPALGPLLLPQEAKSLFDQRIPSPPEMPRLPRSKEEWAANVDQYQQYEKDFEKYSEQFRNQWSERQRTKNGLPSEYTKRHADALTRHGQYQQHIQGLISQNPFTEEDEIKHAAMQISPSLEKGRDKEDASQDEQQKAEQIYERLSPEDRKAHALMTEQANAGPAKAGLPDRQPVNNLGELESTQQAEPEQTQIAETQTQPQQSLAQKDFSEALEERFRLAREQMEGKSTSPSKPTETPILSPEEKKVIQEGASNGAQPQRLSKEEIEGAGHIDDQAPYEEDHHLEKPTFAAVKADIARWAEEGNSHHGIMKPTSEQLPAITSDERVKLIRGGPGGGKTATAVSAAMHAMAKDPNLAPENILAVSALHSARTALDEKLEGFIGGMPNEDRYKTEARTFHSMAHGILFKHHEIPRTEEFFYPTLNALGMEDYSPDILETKSDEELDRMSPEEKEIARKNSQETFIFESLKAAHAKNPFRKGQEPNEADGRRFAAQISQWQKQRLFPDDPRYGTKEDEYNNAWQQGIKDLQAGKKSDQAAFVAYNQGKVNKQQLDHDDVLFHGIRALKTLGEDALPENLKNIGVVVADEGQDLTQHNKLLLQNYLMAIGKNDPRLIVAYDTAQSQMESLGGYQPNDVIPNLVDMAQQGTGNEPRHHTLTINHRSDPDVVARMNAWLDDDSLKGEKVSPKQTPGKRVIGKGFTSTMRKSQPALYDAMARDMIKATGVPVEVIKQNMLAGRQAFEGVDFTQPGLQSPVVEDPNTKKIMPNIAGIVSMRKQLPLFNRAVRDMMMGDEWGLSKNQADKFAPQLFRKGPVPRDATDKEKELARNQFSLLKVGQARSLGIKNVFADITRVGLWQNAKNVASYTRSAFISGSRQLAGGQNHFYAASRPFSRPQINKYLKTSPGEGFSETNVNSPLYGEVKLGKDKVEPNDRSINAPEKVNGQWMPPLLARNEKKAQAQLQEWVKAGLVDPPANAQKDKAARQEPPSSEGTSAEGIDYQPPEMKNPVISNNDNGAQGPSIDSLFSDDESLSPPPAIDPIQLQGGVGGGGNNNGNGGLPPTTSPDDDFPEKQKPSNQPLFAGGNVGGGDDEHTDGHVVKVKGLRGLRFSLRGEKEQGANIWKLISQQKAPSVKELLGANWDQSAMRFRGYTPLRLHEVLQAHNQRPDLQQATPNPLRLVDIIRKNREEQRAAIGNRSPFANRYEEWQHTLKQMGMAHVTPQQLLAQSKDLISPSLQKHIASYQDAIQTKRTPTSRQRFGISSFFNWVRGGEKPPLPSEEEMKPYAHPDIMNVLGPIEQHVEDYNQVNRHPYTPDENTTVAGMAPIFPAKSNQTLVSADGTIGAPPVADIHANPGPIPLQMHGPAPAQEPIMEARWPIPPSRQTGTPPPGDTGVVPPPPVPNSAPPAPSQPPSHSNVPVPPPGSPLQGDAPQRPVFGQPLPAAPATTPPPAANNQWVQPHQQVLPGMGAKDVFIQANTAQVKTQTAQVSGPPSTPNAGDASSFLSRLFGLFTGGDGSGSSPKNSGKKKKSSGGKGTNGWGSSVSGDDEEEEEEPKKPNKVRQIGHEMARISSEMQYIGIGANQLTDDALAQGAAYRRATLLQGSGGTTGTDGYFDFLNSKSGINRLQAQIPMFSKVQIAQQMQQTSSTMNTGGLNVENPTRTILGLSALTGVDSTSLNNQLTQIIGSAGQGKNLNAITDIGNNLTQMYGGNLSASNVDPTLSALQSILPTMQGFQPGGKSQIQDIMSIFQAATKGSFTAQNLPQVAEAMGTFAQIGTTPNLQQQNFLHNLFPDQQLTASPEMVQYQTQRSESNQQIAQLQLRQQYNAEGMQISINNAQIKMEKANLDMSAVQLQSQQVALQGAQMQQDYNVASYNLKQHQDIAMYGDIGQDTSRTGYFNFMRSQQAAGYNATSPENSQYFKAGNTFGVENAKFYAGVEHQRSDMVLGRSSLLSDAKFSEDMKYLNEQETFYNEELKLRNEQRSFERDWTKKLLDQQQKSIDQQQKALEQQKLIYDLQKDRYGLDVARNNFENANLELQKKFLPEQIENLKKMQIAMDQQLNGNGPIDNQYKSPQDILRQLSIVGKTDDAKLHQLIKEGVPLQQQDTVYRLVKDINAQGGYDKVMKGNTKDDKALQKKIDDLNKQGAFADKNNAASLQDAILAWAGKDNNWQNLVDSFKSTAGYLKTIAETLAPLAPELKWVGAIGTVLGPIGMGIAAILNIVGLLVPAGAGPAIGGMLGPMLPILTGLGIQIGGGIFGWNDYNQKDSLTNKNFDFSWKNLIPFYDAGKDSHEKWNLATDPKARGDWGAEWNKEKKQVDDWWNNQPWNPWRTDPNDKHNGGGNFGGSGGPGPGGKNSHVTVGANALANIDWGKIGKQMQGNWDSNFGPKSPISILFNKTIPQNWNGLIGTMGANWNSNFGPKSPIGVFFNKTIPDNWNSNFGPKSPIGVFFNKTIPDNWNNMIGKAGQFWNDLPKNWQDNVVGPIGAKWNEAIKNLPNIPGDVVNSFKDGIKGFLNIPKGQSLFGTFEDNIKNLFGLPKDKSLWQAIQDKMGNMFNWSGGGNNQGGGEFGGGSGSSENFEGITVPHINTQFGQQMWYGKHQGIDFQAAQGTPLREFVGGKVTAAGFHPWGGEVDVALPGGMTERYLHLSALLAHPGQTLPRGAMVGLTGGGTPQSGLGYWSNGSHLHWQLDRGNINAGVNPWPYLHLYSENNVYRMLGASVSGRGKGGAGGFAVDLPPGKENQAMSPDELKALMADSQDEKKKAQAQFSKGGVAMQRMTADVAEVEPEAIIPLSKLIQTLATATSARQAQVTPTQPLAKQPTSVTVSKLAEKFELHVHTSSASLDEQAKDALMAQLLEILSDTLNKFNGGQG